MLPPFVTLKTDPPVLHHAHRQAPPLDQRIVKTIAISLCLILFEKRVGASLQFAHGVRHWHRE